MVIVDKKVIWTHTLRSFGTWSPTFGRFVSHGFTKIRFVLPSLVTWLVVGQHRIVLIDVQFISFDLWCGTARCSDPDPLCAVWRDRKPHRYRKLARFGIDLDDVDRAVERFCFPSS